MIENENSVFVYLNKKRLLSKKKSFVRMQPQPHPIAYYRNTLRERTMFTNKELCSFQPIRAFAATRDLLVSADFLGYF